MNASLRLLSGMGCLLALTGTRCLGQQPVQRPKAVAVQPSSGQPSWPSPVADNGTYSFLLFDNAEVQNAGRDNAVRWDIFGWRGGDVHRLWFKSEGRVTNALEEDSEFEAMALYGRLVAPFFDLQAGVRYAQRVQPGRDASRVYAVIGLQGLSPYRFEIEPALFLSQKGKVSGRLTGTYDVLLTQRIVLQPRLESNFAVQSDESIGIGAGVNDAELGARLRYEVRREFAPYFGLTWKESIGATHRLNVRTGSDARHFALVAGLRMWF